jgi:hypothetical protein
MENFVNCSTIGWSRSEVLIAAIKEESTVFTQGSYIMRKMAVFVDK